MNVTAADPRSFAQRLARRSAAPLIAGLIGFAWFVRWAGWEILDPTHVDWLLTGDDWTPHYLGWAFFRNEPLALPLGRLDGLLHPVGTTLGFTDSNPLVSLLLRPLSGFLPRPFQFIGPWLALCCILQGVVGARFAARFTDNPALQALAGGLLATSPMLITRSGHDTLCAQWILVFLIGLNLGAVRSPAEARRSVGGAVLLLILAAAIHPYLAAMALALGLALVWRLALGDRKAAGSVLRRPVATALVGTAILPLTVLGVFALLGYFAGGVSSVSSGFGAHTSDLTSLINPRGQSRLLPDLAASRPSYEGWGYLGAGALLLTLLSFISVALRWKEVSKLPWWRSVPLLLVTVALTLFALGPEVNLGSRTLLRLDFLFDPFDRLTSTFRASGRFIWVAHYVIAAGAIAGVLRLWRFRSSVAVVALGAAVALQWLSFDWKGTGVFRRDPPSLRAEAWQLVGEGYRHLVLVPPQVVYGPAPCGGELPGNSWVLFGELASRLGMTFNSGYVARYDADAIAASCRQTIAEVRRGELSRDSVYVLSQQVLRNTRWPEDTVRCGRMEGFAVCVAAEHVTPLSRLLTQ